MADPTLNEDFVDLLQNFIEHDVRFILVGAHAMAAHGVARATGDMDILVSPGAENANRVVQALEDFGAPLSAHGVTGADFSRPDTVYQMGLPPRRIDLLTSVTGLSFEEAWASRVAVVLQGMAIPVLGIEALIKNKEAAAREKDLLDVKLLRAKLPT